MKNVFIMIVGICGITGAILHFFFKEDEELRRCGIRKICCSLSFWSIAVPIGMHICVGGISYKITGEYWLLAVYFVLCGVVDGLLKQVYNMFHWLGLLGGSVLLWQNTPPRELLSSLILFVLFQGFIFRKMYGKADVCGFVICAMYLTAVGHDLEGFLLHMAVTFLLLGVVQTLRHNISAKGNLKEPVALFPYIIVGFFVII